MLGLARHSWITARLLSTSSYGDITTMASIFAVFGYRMTARIVLQLTSILVRLDFAIHRLQDCIHHTAITASIRRAIRSSPSYIFNFFGNLLDACERTCVRLAIPVNICLWAIALPAASGVDDTNKGPPKFDGDRQSFTGWVPPPPRTLT
jgi:hypothetical protein